MLLQEEANKLPVLHVCQHLDRSRDSLQASGVDLRLLELYEEMMLHAEKDDWDLFNDDPEPAQEQPSNHITDSRPSVLPPICDSTSDHTRRGSSDSSASISSTWDNTRVLEGLSKLKPNEQAYFVALCLQQIGDEGMVDVAQNTNAATNLCLARVTVANLEEAHLTMLASELPQQLQGHLYPHFLQAMLDGMSVLERQEVLCDGLEGKELSVVDAHRLHSAMYTKLSQVAPDVITRGLLGASTASGEKGDETTVQLTQSSVEDGMLSPSSARGDVSVAELHVSNERWVPLATHSSDQDNEPDCKGVQVDFDYDDEDSDDDNGDGMNGDGARKRLTRGRSGKRKDGRKRGTSSTVPTTVEDEVGQVWLKVPLPWSKYLSKKLVKRRALDKSVLADSVIGDVYMKKILADRDLGGRGRRHSLAQTVFHHFLQKFGLKRLAEDNIASLVQAVQSHAKESRRIKLFGTLVGVLHQNYYTPILGDVVVEVLCQVCPPKQVAALFAKGADKTVVPLNDAIRAIRHSFHVIDRDGIKRGAEITAAPTESLVDPTAVAESSDKPNEFLAETSELHRSWSMPQDIRHRLLTRVEGIAKSAAQLGMEGPIQMVDLDEFLDVVLEEFLVKLRVDYLMVLALFGKFDHDRNGVLNYAEFTNLINQCQPSPELKDTQIMDLFLAINDVEGDDDDTISKETFAATCVTRCLHLPYWKLDADGEMASILQSLGIIVSKAK